MIQRIQSVYLFFIAGFMLAMFFLPVAIFSTASAESFILQPVSLFSFPKCSGWILSGLLLLISIISLWAFCSYKKRLKQIKLCYLNVVLIVLVCIMLVIIYLPFASENGISTFKFPATFPLIALILDFMAISRIKKDEKLVRSLDRIR